MSVPVAVSSVDTTIPVLRETCGIRAWLRSWVADDPDPQYSRLDRMDGLDTRGRGAA